MQHSSQLDNGTSVNLKAITRHNFEQASALKVTPNQEPSMSNNTWSMAQACFNPHYQMRGVYQGAELQGFMMWVPESSARVSIWRFMMDEKYQNKGVGRQALGLALNEIKNQPGLQEIEICYDPTNPLAQPFYQSFGFEDVGLEEGGSDMLAVIRL